MSTFGKQSVYNTNRKVIFDLIRKNAPILRTEIKKISNIRLATITEITKKLLDEGLIVEVSKSDNNTHKTKLLALNSSQFYAMSADIQAKRVLILLTDTAFNIIYQIEKSIKKTDTPNQIIDMMFEGIDEIFNLFKEKHIIGIGISFTGMIDREKCVILASSQLQGWVNIPIKEIVQSRYQLPVFIDDSTPLNLLAERLDEDIAKCNDIIYVQIGAGIGTAIMSDGRFVRGHLGLAGELGHSVVSQGGKPCPCGNYGCLRTIATSEEIVNRVIESLESGTYSIIYEMVDGDLSKVDIHSILSAAEQNDKIALNITDEISHYLGIALANCINILNPKMLIFGGEMFERSDYMLEPIQHVIAKNILPQFAPEIVYRKAYFAEIGGAIGAAALVFEEYFLQIV